MNKQHIWMGTKMDNKFPYETPICYFIAWIKKLSVSLVENKTEKKVEWISDKDMNANIDTNAKLKMELILSLRSGSRPHQNQTDTRDTQSNKISMD